VKKYYTFLVIGATGTGKTTLLDAFTNRLSDVRFTDHWRWKLVDEDHMQAKHGSASMTTDISYYYISDERPLSEGRRPCHVRIIDTPGFGDTRGVAADEGIVKQFERLFTEEVHELDCILIVVKAGETRWTESNRYVYDRIQQMFGKDASTRFVLMCTFADGAPPLAPRTLRPYVTFQEVFPFNNSALYVPSDTGNEQTKAFWKMCTSSVDSFLTFVVTSYDLPLSLTRSVEVLELRKALYERIQSAQVRINKSFQWLESTSRLVEEIKDHEEDINANGSFMYTEMVEKVRTEPLGNTYQMCQACQETCCQVCVWPAGATESACTYFHGGQQCPVCRGKCPKSSHVRADYKIIKEMVPETREYQHMKDRLRLGQEGLSAAQALLEEKRQEMHREAQHMLTDMQTVKTSLGELDKVALKPRVFTNAEYFQQMIQHEQDSKQPGHEERIAGLRLLAERAETIEKFAQAENLEELFPQYRSVIDQVVDKVGAKSSRKTCALM